MSHDHAGKAPYRRIADQIIERIRSGELQPGDPVPSVTQIMESQGVSRGTAAKIPGVLRAEGWAVATPGVGTIVATPKKVRAGAARLTRQQAGGASLQGDERVEILGAQMEPASQEVADALGLEVGAEVVRRRRRYLDKSGVAAVSTTWIAGSIAEVAPELLQDGPLPKMTFGLIEERTGRRATRFSETVGIRRVPEDIAGHLEVEVGAETLVLVNRYVDQHGEPTEFAIDYHGAGRELSAERDLD